MAGKYTHSVTASDPFGPRQTFLIHPSHWATVVAMLAAVEKDSELLYAQAAPDSEGGF